jgi:fermentation-respiration switch protein FrsA (DUF1100 family)
VCKEQIANSEYQRGTNVLLQRKRKGEEFAHYLSSDPDMGPAVSMLLFQPPPPSYTDETDQNGRFFRLETSRNQTIGAFFIDAGESHTILFSHGNAEDIGLIYSWFCEVSTVLSVNVMSYDYTGYGINQAEPSEEDVFADSEAAFEYLTVTRGIPPSRIILWGRSLGSGPTCYLAKRQSDLEKPVSGVILSSALLSAYRVAFHFRFSLPGDRFCNADVVQHIKSPVLVIHGTNDEIVPFWHGQELLMAVDKKFRFKPYWVENAGHNNVEAVNTKEFFQHLCLFLDAVS